MMNEKQMLETKEPRVRIQPYVAPETHRILTILARQTGHFPGTILDRIVAYYGTEWAKHVRTKK